MSVTDDVRVVQPRSVLPDNVEEEEEENDHDDVSLFSNHSEEKYSHRYKDMLYFELTMPNAQIVLVQGRIYIILLKMVQLYFLFLLDSSV